MNGKTRTRVLTPKDLVFGARFQAVVGQLRTARCECGNPQKADCYRFTSDRGAWCWPCKCAGLCARMP